MQVERRRVVDRCHAARQAGPRCCWTSDFLKKSKCSSARPVPRATQFREFSATWHGTPVTWVSSLSMLRSSEPPPDITMPLSMMSELKLRRRLLEHVPDRGDQLLERHLDGLHDLGAA